jgi:putative FmdB family regulatory protein
VPIYVYQSTEEPGCPTCNPGFERLQKLRALPLNRCPRCGATVRRVISAPNIASQGAELSERNIERHGFTQYRKTEKGVYEKTVGKGPDLISDKD